MLRDKVQPYSKFQSDGKFGKNVWIEIVYGFVLRYCDLIKEVHKYKQ